MLPERYHAAQYCMSELIEEGEQGLQTKDPKKSRRVLAAFRKGWGGEVWVQILITRHF